MNKSAGGFSFGYSTIINSLDILSQIQLEIVKRLNEQGVVTVPPQDIIFHSQTIGLPIRNVVHPNAPVKGRFFARVYNSNEAIIKFHYHSQERLKKTR